MSWYIRPKKWAQEGGMEGKKRQVVRWLGRDRGDGKRKHISLAESCSKLASISLTSYIVYD